MGWRPSSARSSLLPSPPASLSPHPPHHHLFPLTASPGFQVVPPGEAGTGQGQLLGTEVQEGVRMAWTSPPGLWGAMATPPCSSQLLQGPLSTSPRAPLGDQSISLLPYPLEDQNISCLLYPLGGTISHHYGPSAPHPALTTSPGPCLHRVFSSLSTL